MQMAIPGGAAGTGSLHGEDCSAQPAEDPSAVEGRQWDPEQPEDAAADEEQHGVPGGCSLGFWKPVPDGPTGGPAAADRPVEERT